MHRAPVIGEYAAGVPRVGVPRPEGPAHATVTEIVGELSNPTTFNGGGRNAFGTELANENGGNALGVNVAEALLPSISQNRGHIRIVEPGLVEHSGTVFVG